MNQALTYVFIQGRSQQPWISLLRVTSRIEADQKRSPNPSYSDLETKY